MKRAREYSAFLDTVRRPGHRSPKSMILNVIDSAAELRNILGDRTLIATPVGTAVTAALEVLTQIGPVALSYYRDLP